MSTEPIDDDEDDDEFSLYDAAHAVVAEMLEPREEGEPKPPTLEDIEDAYPHLEWDVRNVGSEERPNLEYFATMGDDGADAGVSFRFDDRLTFGWHWADTVVKIDGVADWRGAILLAMNEVQRMLDYEKEMGKGIALRMRGALGLNEPLRVVKPPE